MLGPSAFVRTLSEPTRVDQYGNRWQYHSRSDHHSKVACTLILLDLLTHCPLLASHARERKVFFGINHELRDFRNNRKKNLDLVVCKPALGRRPSRHDTLDDLVERWRLDLSSDEQERVRALPQMESAPVGHVLIALEAKACMTAHQAALPRLYDELNSSHLTVHGAFEDAIAVGFVAINASSSYLSPDRNKRTIDGAPTWSRHKQPFSAQITTRKIEEIPRRSRKGEEGYDALGIVVIDFKNDGTPVELVSKPPAPRPGDVYHYGTMISRVSAAYATRFGSL